MLPLLQRHKYGLATGGLTALVAYAALGLAADRAIEREQAAFVAPVAHSANNPEAPLASTAQEFDDGKIVSGAHAELPRQCPTCGVYGCRTHWRGNVGFWRRGPIRKVISAPFRWLFRRRC